MTGKVRRGRDRVLAGRRHLRISALLFLGLLLLPHSAAAWWNGDWSFRKKITLDASPKGAALAQDIARMPVLIRLHDGNFRFADAKDDGSDVRFVAADDKTPLKFHIESYDAVLGIALIWLDAPPLRTGGTTDVWLYYGNSKASAAADPRGTYDADTLLVYHFVERNGLPKDSTANANNAQTPARPTGSALIGGGVRFDGTNGIEIPASPSLSLAQGGAFTWSAWIKPDALQDTAVLFAKRDAERSIVVKLDQGVPGVTLSDGAQTQRTGPVDPIAPQSWHHIAVTAADQVTLYVDGQVRATLAAAFPALGGGANIGADVPVSGAAPSGGFAGEMDEMQIAKVARSAAFIAAEVASQGPDGQMLAYGEDEQASSIGGGSFGFIFKSVTLDGWVVIGLLGVMAAASWVVMFTKTRYVNAVARANDRFLESFSKAGADIGRVEEILAASGTRGLQRSPLYRIYQAGTEELSRRFDADPRVARILPEQSVAAIRASLDRVATREGQRLNAQMVLLTIAISGGPFLGLLGTVVGVMITFAAIAAEGDVNINAIAPGMAAALAATVAGLSVAIPALFGYNYLISRIKDSTTDMHVFVDEFATRLAETYRAYPQPQNLAAE